jgi:branched-chain amino acid transport system substrate-binding protein
MYDAEAGPFMQQARGAGLDATFAGSGAILTQDFLKLAGDAGNGVYSDSAPLTVQAENSPDLAAFVDAYRAAYQHDPDNFAESMYSDFQIVGQALAEGATDRQSLRDKMATIKDFKNASGIASFDENRDAMLTQHQISVVQDQKWQLYTTFQ